MPSGPTSLDEGKPKIMVICAGVSYDIYVFFVGGG